MLAQVKHLLGDTRSLPLLAIHLECVVVAPVETVEFSDTFISKIVGAVQDIGIIIRTRTCSLTEVVEMFRNQLGSSLFERVGLVATPYFRYRGPHSFDSACRTEETMVVGVAFRVIRSVAELMDA